MRRKENLFIFFIPFANWCTKSHVSFLYKDEAFFSSSTQKEKKNKTRVHGEKKDEVEEEREKKKADL